MNEAKIIQNPFLNRLGNGFMIEELFCWFQVLRQHFMFLSFCIRLPFIVYSFPLTFLSFSFHVPFMCINFPVFSCNIPFIFISMCIHVLSFSFHFLSFCIHVLSFHFKSYGNGSMAWPGDRVQQIVIAKLSLLLSLNNLSNIWYCSKEICHKNNREREREKERERESASELDAKWYGNRRKQGTTGWISIIVFARSVNVHNSMCLVYAKLNGLSCMVPGYPFSLYIYSFLCTPLTKKLLQY